MPKFRKKPVVIEAIRLETVNRDQIIHAFVPNERTPLVMVVDRNHHILYATITTLEGTHRADVGDWIIKGVAGELYPCKPDIFAATYDPVEE